MDKSKFLEYIENNNNGSILYEYHLTRDVKKLSWQEFVIRLQKIDTYSSFGLFDLNGFIIYVKKYFMIEFEICAVRDKKGMIIKLI